MLGLETAQAPVGEVTQAPVIEMRLLTDVKPRHRDRIARRNDIPVPEVAAAGLALEEVVDGIERGAAVAAGQKEQVALPVAGRHDAVGIAPGAEVQRFDKAPLDRIAREAVHAVGTDDHERNAGLRLADDLQFAARNGTVELAELTGRMARRPEPLRGVRGFSTPRPTRRSTKGHGTCHEKGEQELLHTVSGFVFGFKDNK